MSKRVLVISPIFSHPLTSGNRARIYRLLLNLRELNHEVHFLYVDTEDVDEKLAKTYWDNLYVVPYKPPHKTLIKRIIRKFKRICGWESAFLYGIDAWYDPDLNNFLIQLSKQINFDVVIVEYVFFSKALDFFDQNTLKIIDTHDVFTNRHKIYLKNNESPNFYSTTAKEEAKALNRADIIIAIQQKEKNFFSKLSNKKTVVIGHTVSLEKPLQRASINKALLFLGSSNPMNVQGINHFIKNIFPQVRLHFPTLSLIIAGSICNAVEDFEHCTKLGEVKNLKDIYDMADLVINPILFGTGLKIKTIEALGYSKPLVTTSVGAEGLESGINQAFLVADQPEDFAQSIINVFSDVELLTSLSENAYNFAKEWNEANLRELAAILG